MLTLWYRRGAPVVLVAIVAMALPGVARAGVEKDFAAAEAAYYNGDYEEAVFLMEELSRREGVKRDTRVAALKYTAFCYFLLGSKPQAKAAWRRLLDLEPDFHLDSLEDPPRFVEFFNPLGDAGAESPEGAQAGPGAPAAPKNKATQGPIPEVAPRGCGIVLCLVPFGVGQLANDQLVKGILFSGLETLFLGLNIGFYYQNQNELGANGGQFADEGRANDRNVAQNVFFGLFLTTVAVGVVDAYLFY